VQTELPVTAARVEEYLNQLGRAYPFLEIEQLARSAYGRPIWAVTIGEGERRVLYSAAHHANEWLTATVLLKFIEDYAEALQNDGQIGGIPARALYQSATISLVPLVNPDGVDLVTGAMTPESAQYLLARELAQKYPAIPFPEGWKANLLGVDLNLNYPAGWLQAREIKFSQGYTSPGPRDYVGRAPLDQMETRALADLTEKLDPDLVLAYHSQGKEIYWQFRDYEVPGAKELGEVMARVSGYTLADTPYASSFAGYKDWFIQNFRRPGYTVEVGMGENPLPLSQFAEIYRDNVPLLNIAALGL
jgi:g-D-glutamyl-meso-diaminopimelate peptidase